MFESFIIMVREGIEAALVIGIILVILRRSGRRDLERPVFTGVGLACLASFGAAVALTKLPINGEAYEGILYWTAAFFVITMMWWMHRNARSLRADIEGRVQRVIGATPESRGREAWGLGAFAFLMVFREGAETVLFLSAINLTTSAILSFSGAALGLTLAVTFCVMFVRGSLKVDLRRFFTVTEWVLGIFVVQLVVNGYHELAEAGLMPATRESMALVGPIVRNNSLFLLAILGLPLFFWLSRSKEESAPAEGATAAEERLALAAAKRESLYRKGAIATTLIALGSVSVLYAQEAATVELPPPAVVEAEDGWVNLSLASLDDGILHRMAYTSGDTDVRFLALKRSDGTVHTTLDACEICGPAGYMQDGVHLICLNCTAEINPLSLGASGGCNPIPLDSEITGDSIRIAVSDLEAAAPIFPAVGEVQVAGLDPICGMTVNADAAVASEQHNGETYYFCSEQCHELFLENPDAQRAM